MMAAAAEAAGAFTITLDGVEYPVVAEGGQGSSWTVVVNGRCFTVEPAEDGTVLVDGIAYEVSVDEETVNVGDASHALEVSGLSVGRATPGTPPRSAPSAEGEGGAGAIVAIMPGQVTRVMVVEGQEVEENEAVCVLEAMKMENELRTDRSGVVKAVHVAPGDDVEKGQVLVEVE